MDKNEVLFSRKIKCKHCGKNYKGKKERGRRIYICSSYDNGTGNCKREVLSEEDLVELLLRRYGKEFEITKENIQNTVENIIVEDKWTFTINLKNDKPIIFGDNFIQY